MLMVNIYPNHSRLINIDLNWAKLSKNRTNRLVIDNYTIIGRLLDNIECLGWYKCRAQFRPLNNIESKKNNSWKWRYKFKCPWLFRIIISRLIDNHE